MTTNFQNLIPSLTKLLKFHHALYSGQCKAEAWEELCSKALCACGLGSDWKPDYNHKTGVDQITDAGIRISNKSGEFKNDTIEISGSRLTKHKTLKDKINFISQKHDDYILCLATSNDWTTEKPIYYLIVIKSDDIAYDKAEWVETIGTRGKLKGKVNGWETSSAKGFSASIRMSMSDQLWTKIDSSLFQEVYKIEL